MIEIVYDKNLGIRLFQYAFARRLADQWNMFLPEPTFTVPLRLQASHGRKILNPLWIIDGHQPRDAELNRRLRGSDFSINPECKIIIAGPLDDVSLAPDSLGSWSFHLPSPIRNEGEDAVIVLCRTRADYLTKTGANGRMVHYVGFRTFPAVPQIAEWVETNGHRRVHIITDAASEPHCAAARAYGWRLTIADGWERIFHSSGLVAALITEDPLDWWAAALNDAPSVTVLERRRPRPCMSPGGCGKDLTVQTGWPSYRLRHPRCSYSSLISDPAPE